MNPTRQVQLLKFLETELGIPLNALALAQRQSEPAPNHLPMTLFQYGLITLDQLASIFDWLEAV